MTTSYSCNKIFQNSHEGRNIFIAPFSFTKHHTPCMKNQKYLQRLYVSQFETSYHNHVSVTPPSYNPSSTPSSSDLNDQKINLNSSLKSPNTHNKGMDNEYERKKQHVLANKNKNEQFSLERLCSLLNISGSSSLFLSKGLDGVRGLYTNKDILKNEVVMEIPLSSCIVDNKPPSWLQNDYIHREDDDGDYDSIDTKDTFKENEGTNKVLDPRKWATRLAASLVDIQMEKHDSKDRKSDDRQKENNVNTGLKEWLSSMPDPGFLSASLPVHWPEETISNAKCTALELAVDSSYFARGEAVQDMLVSINEQNQQISQVGKMQKVEDKNNEKKYHNFDQDEVDLESICQNMLDIVQTRSCRVETSDAQWGPPLRVIAPVFDYINHGFSSSESFPGQGCANTYFGLEQGKSSSPSIIVRAKSHIRSNDEILIDYGASTRPAWRCLVSYGFVPEYNSHIPHSGDDSNIVDLINDRENANVAEVYLNGRRFEVGKSTIPADLVEAAHESLIVDHLEDVFDSDFELLTSHEDEITDDTSFSDTNENDIESFLSPPIAIKLAKRLSDAAFALLLEPELEFSNDIGVDCPNAIIAARLAAALRWSQHKVLLDCALSLRDYTSNESLQLEED
jgi:hypothetical protein